MTVPLHLMSIYQELHMQCSSKELRVTRSTKLLFGNFGKEISKNRVSTFI